LLRRFGPVKVLPEKTRIAFQVRMSFAQVSVRIGHLAGHFVLAERVTDRRFTKVESYSPRNHVHHFRLTSLSQLDREFARFAQAAYAVGRQDHLARRGRANQKDGK